MCAPIWDEQEIFGPLFPVWRFSDVGQARSYVNANPKPLAMYIFSWPLKSTYLKPETCS